MSETHDYSGEHRCWGHDYNVVRVVDGGMWLVLMGHGRGIKEKDYLILDNGQETTRYYVADIEYFLDPPDMWKIHAKFTPRRGE
jgi:hypothetical protein